MWMWTNADSVLLLIHLWLRPLSCTAEQDWYLFIHRSPPVITCNWVISEKIFACMLWAWQKPVIRFLLACHMWCSWPVSPLSGAVGLVMKERSADPLSCLCCSSFRRLQRIRSFLETSRWEIAEKRTVNTSEEWIIHDRSRFQHVLADFCYPNLLPRILAGCCFLVNMLTVATSDLVLPKRSTGLAMIASFPELQKCFSNRNKVGSSGTGDVFEQNGPKSRRTSLRAP